MKSTSGPASCAEQTVANNIVLPIFSMTAPSACLANFPVSNVITRPSFRVMLFSIMFIEIIKLLKY